MKQKLIGKIFSVGSKLMSEDQILERAKGTYNSIAQTSLR